MGEASEEASEVVNEVVNEVADYYEMEWLVVV
jgi:hypothetical protein